MDIRPNNSQSQNNQDPRSPDRVGTKAETQNTTSSEQEGSGYRQVPSDSSSVQPNQSARSGSNVLAIASLVLGIIAAILGLFIIGSVFGVGGIVIGIIALVKKQSKPLAITGIVLSAIAIVVATFMVFSTASTLEDARMRTRDKTRENDLETIKNQLEDYHAVNGYYPDNLRELRPEHLEKIPTDPQSPERAYRYVPVAENGGSCTTADQNCVRYRLVTELEKDNHANDEGNYVLREGE